MLINGQLLVGTTLNCDVCVIGGGVAGLVAAEQLSALPLSVCVLESGERKPPSSEALDALRIESTGSELEPFSESRTRQLGGTAHIWNTFIGGRPAAVFLRLDQIDFERRNWLPHSGWPFTLDAIEPYYQRAEARLMPACTAEQWQEIARVPSLPLDPDRVVTLVDRFSTSEVFTDELPTNLKRHPRVKIVTQSTVAEILLNEYGTKAECVRVVVSRGRQFNVAFRILIVAAGAIENARLLLCSRGIHPAGVGNRNDLVGRFFMDRQRLNAGSLAPFDRGLFDRTAKYDLRAFGRHYVMAKLALSEELRRERRLLNSRTMLLPRPEAADKRGVNALKTFIALARKAQVGKESWLQLRHILAARRYLLSTGPMLAVAQRYFPPNITRGGWSLLSNNKSRFAFYELVQQVEQAPDPANRIVLSTERDAFGVCLPRVHAKWTEVDLQSARQSQAILAEELERAGIGKVLYAENAEFPDLHQRGGMHHHLGTTRMHVDPKHGVVDAQSRVHGVPNLFLAGGSVFPTGGYANPTLTIAALTMRLADQVKHSYGRFDVWPTSAIPQLRKEREA